MPFQGIQRLFSVVDRIDVVAGLAQNAGETPTRLPAGLGQENFLRWETGAALALVRIQTQQVGGAWRRPGLHAERLEQSGFVQRGLDDAEVAVVIELADVTGVGEYEIMGESLDDAVGEAFDKTAKLLGLPYPGGPSVSKAAERGISGRFEFPRPMTDRPGLDFSFSGLKTFALNTWRDSDQTDQDRADIAHAFEEAVVDTMVIKCRRAVAQTGLQTLVIAGGVGANERLRARLAELMTKEGGRICYPRPEFCTDNGAMIAYAGYCRLQAGQAESLSIRATPRWSLEELEAAGPEPLA